MAKKILALEKKNSAGEYRAALELALSSSDEEIRKALESSYTLAPDRPM